MTSWNEGRKAFWRISSAGIAVAAVLSTGAVAAAQSASRGQVTFSKDVAPILQRTCQNCHRPNQGMAPRALTTYEEVRPWAKAIKQKTSAGEMPPWFIERHVGSARKYQNDISLTEKELETIAAWVDAGAPRGNPADLPSPRAFNDSGSWTIGEPDLIVNSPLYVVPAEAGDWHGDSGFSPTGLKEDRWVSAVEVREFRPGEQTRSKGAGGGNNYLVIHHAGVSTSANGGGGEEDPAPTPVRGGGGGAGQGFFSYLYEVGQNGQTYPADLGVKLEAGSNFYFSNHRHSIGKEVKVQLQVGLKFHPKGYTPKYPQGLSALTGWGGWGAELDIPGNQDDGRWDKFAVLPKPARMVTFEPHLHASGKRMCVEAIYPSGDREMISCAGYNHAWVKSYVFEEDSAPLLPAGTIIHAISWYDNTAKNPRVVDPRNWRGLGLRSVDDMNIVFNKFVLLSEDEYKTELAERAAKSKQFDSTATAQR